MQRGQRRRFRVGESQTNEPLPASLVHVLNELLAFDADVTPLLRALSEICPLSAVAVLTGAQK